MVERTPHDSEVMRSALLFLTLSSVLKQGSLKEVKPLIILLK